jgi:hypothetical protein
MALIGNTADTYGQTWHLPVTIIDSPKQFITEIGQQLGREINYKVLHKVVLKIGSLLTITLRKHKNTPRYAIDNIFKSSKFKTRFPDFVTTYPEGIKMIIKDFNIK